MNDKNYLMYLNEKEILFIKKTLEKEKKNKLSEDIISNINDILKTYPI